MAIDPIAPVSPILATPALGTDPAAHTQALLALARAAVADNVATVGALVGGGNSESLVQTKGSSGPALTAPSPTAPDRIESSPLTTRERLTAAVRSAVTQAAPRQAGLSPMMANLDAIVTHPDTPEPVRQAAWAVLDKAVPTDQPLSAAAFRVAVRDSGLFMESRLARSGITERPTASSAPLQHSPKLPDGMDMKAALLVFKAVVATWVAKVLPSPSSPATVADDSGDAAAPNKAPAPARPETSVVASPPMPLPGMVERSAIETVTRTTTRTGPSDLQDRPTIGTPPAPRSERATSAATGATPTTASAPAPTSSAQPAAPTSSYAPELAPPRPASAAVLDDITPKPDAPQTPVIATSKTPPRVEPAPQPALQRAMLNVGLIEEEPLGPLPLSEDDVPATAVPRDTSRVAKPAAPPRPPPPYAGGPTTGQPVVLPDLPVDMRPSEVARHLLSNTQATLARQELLQIASLPEARRETDGLAEPKSSRWMFDLPFQTPQGIAVAQFEISRDGGGGAADPDREEDRTWRARFSLDIEPLGPVHVQIALTGARTRVGFWAERPEAVARLQAGEGALSAALREADLSPEVAFHDGAPVLAPSALGRFVDRAS